MSLKFKKLTAAFLVIGLILPSVSYADNELKNKELKSDVITSEETEMINQSLIRVKGSNREATSIAVSESMNENNAEAIIADGRNFPDALFAGPLASTLRSPILLSTSNNLSIKIENELKRLGVEKVYIVGGISSVSKDIENKLKLHKYNVVRISGKNRIETAEKVDNFRHEIKRDKINDEDNAVYVNAFNYPDALAASPFVSYLDKKLSNGVRYRGVDPKRMNTISRYPLYAIGGESSVPRIQGELNRISGKDRYDTSLKLVRKASELIGSENTLFIASGEGFADALSSSPYVTEKKGSLALTKGDKLSDDLRNYIKNSKVDRVFIIGGNSSVSEDIEKEIKIILLEKFRNSKTKKVDVKKEDTLNKDNKDEKVANPTDKNDNVTNDKDKESTVKTK